MLIFHYCNSPFGHLTAVSDVGSSQVLLAGVPGGFSLGSPVFFPPIDRPVSYELKTSTYAFVL